jgi:hypothetical protein
MLFEIFNAVGPVHSIRFTHHSMATKILGRPALCSAYVQFFNILDGMALAHLLWHFVAYFLAERALHTLNNSVILGRPCCIRAKPPAFNLSASNEDIEQSAKIVPSHDSFDDLNRELKSLLADIPPAQEPPLSLASQKAANELNSDVSPSQNEISLSANLNALKEVRKERLAHNRRQQKVRFVFVIFVLFFFFPVCFSILFKFTL